MRLGLSCSKRPGLQWTVRVVVAAALLGILSALGEPAVAAPSGQTPPVSNTITVAGEGEATAQPDVAYVSVGVVTQGPTAAQATSENARLLNAVLDALRGRGVESRDLQTSGLNVSPQYAQGRGEQPQITGYQATNNVTVTVNDISRAGELLDAALAAGANRVGGLRFGIRDTGALRAQAIANAVAAARVNAEAIAASLGLPITGVSSVVEESVAVPMPRAAVAFSAPQAAAAPPPTPVEPGELRVSARVRVAFRFD